MKTRQADNLEALAVHLAAGGKLAKFASAMKLPIRTAQRWASSPALRTRVREIRREATDGAVGRLSAAAEEAVDTIESLSKSARSEATKLAAARAILTHGTEMRTAQDNEERFAAIEARLAELAHEPEPTATRERIRLSEPKDTMGNRHDSLPTRPRTR